MTSSPAYSFSIEVWALYFPVPLSITTWWDVSGGRVIFRQRGSPGFSQNDIYIFIYLCVLVGYAWYGATNVLVVDNLKSRYVTGLLRAAVVRPFECLSTDLAKGRATAALVC